MRPGRPATSTKVKQMPELPDDFSDGDICPRAIITGDHVWQVDRARPDPVRPTEFDPMSGAEVYSDTGDPVYNFPYTPVPAGKVREICLSCHKTRERDLAEVIEEERASRAAFWEDDPDYQDRWGRL